VWWFDRAFGRLKKTPSYGISCTFKGVVGPERCLFFDANKLFSMFLGYERGLPAGWPLV
jgi:hypothetical protein